MKIGLLECDHVRQELRGISGDYRDMFPALFRPFAPHWEFRFFDVVNGVFPDNPETCDAYICTGSSFSVYDEVDWIIRLKALVSELNNKGIRYVGVCFGHQLLAEALGGKVKKSDKGWCVGVHTFTLTMNEDWMKPEMQRLNLLMMCQDQVRRLPANAHLLASAEDCPNAMFRVGNHMLGIQAHPEFTSAYDRALMELRTDRIGAGKVAEGIRSLDTVPDAKAIAQWIVQFVEKSL